MKGFQPRIVAFEIGELQADLIETGFLRTNIKYLLSVIDVFSRKAWLVPLKTKGKQETLDAFKTVLADFDKKDLVCTTDKGGEFALFHKVVKHIVIDPHTVDKNRGTAIVERFHQTFWGWLGETIRDRALKVRDWLPLVNEFLKWYNNREHSTIETTPNKVWDETAYPGNLIYTYEEIEQENRLRSKLPQIGDEVIKRNNTSMFAKKSFEGYWDKSKVYKVVGKSGYSYFLQNIKTGQQLRRPRLYRELRVVKNFTASNKDDVAKQRKKNTHERRDRKAGIDLDNVQDRRREPAGLPARYRD